VNESDYSQLIGDYVNDAKRLVEDAWDWSALRHTYTLTMTPEQGLYSLPDFGVRSKVLYVHNETEEYELRQIALEHLRRLELNVDDNSGHVVYYAMQGVDANGDAQIRFYREPDSADEISVYTVRRQDDLTVDSASIAVPTNPVIQLAYAYSLRERGETGGISSGEQAVFANNYLNDAIALDAGLRPEETIWTVV
jgi:hypothetical protein